MAKVQGLGLMMALLEAAPLQQICPLVVPLQIPSKLLG